MISFLVVHGDWTPDPYRRDAQKFGDLSSKDRLLAKSKISRVDWDQLVALDELFHHFSGLKMPIA